MIKLISMFFLLIILFISINSYAITIPCYNCTNCSAEIQGANIGDIVELQNSIEVNNTCIDFGGQDDIVFDCVDYSNYINYNETSSTYSGIRLISSINNTIKNCNISDFYHAIHLSGNSDSNIVDSNTISGSINNGIQIYSSRYNIVTNNIVNYNIADGISTSVGADSNIITSNTVSFNNVNGIQISNSFNNTVDYNIVNNNSLEGIYFYNVVNSSIESNVVNGNTFYGIFLADSSNNQVISNSALYNLNTGFFLDNSHNNTIIDNTFTNNSNNIYFYNNSGDIPQNNTFTQNYLGDSSKIISSDGNTWNNTVYTTNVFNGNYYIDYVSSPFCFLDGTACDLLASDGPVLPVSEKKSIFPFHDSIFLSLMLIVGFLLFN